MLYLNHYFWASFIFKCVKNNLDFEGHVEEFYNRYVFLVVNDLYLESVINNSHSMEAISSLLEKQSDYQRLNN